jgi:hypothetical protein
VAAAAAQGRYMEREEFLRGAFPGGPPEPQTLWIGEDLRESIETGLGHPFAPLRVRYWREGERTAWILDEIGKERPITLGISLMDGKVEEVRVLEFRETRGWEIRFPFFTDQFSGARLDGRGRIDREIDGITGATLSVRAAMRAVRLALLLDGESRR